MINGKDIILYIEKDGQYVATACDKSCTLHLQSDFIVYTDPAQGNIIRRYASTVDWSISGNGLIDYGRLISGLFMQQALLNRTRIMIRFYAKAVNGYAVYSGYGFFQSVDETGEVNNVASYSYVIVADSGLTVVSTIPQDQNEGVLYTVLMNNEDTLTIDNNDNLILIK